MDKIKFKINGKEKYYDSKKITLQMLLEEENIKTQGVAISLNRVFVPKQKIPEISLTNNDEIEIVTPYEGG